MALWHPSVSGPRPLIWKNSGRLADGREIIYFDESPGLGRGRHRDQRPLAGCASGDRRAGRRRPAPSGCAGIRCRASGWSSPPHRQDRTFLPPADECPLGPSAPGRPTEIPAADYDVVVFENRFPSLRGASAIASASRRAGCPRGPLVAERGPASGAARWSASPATTTRRSPTLTPRRVRTVIEAWADRTAALGATARGRAGLPASRTAARRSASPCTHPHGQIYAYPFVTPRTGSSCSRRRAHRAAHRRQPVRRRARAERPAGTRVVPATSTGRRSSRPPPAGRTRCTCPRTAASPTCRPRRRRARRARPTSTSTCCAGSTGCSTAPAARTSPAGTRRRSATGATWPAAPAAVHRCCARPAS